MNRRNALIAASAFLLAALGTAPASAQKMSMADAQRECGTLYGRSGGYGNTNPNTRELIRKCVREKMGASKAKR